MIGYLPQSKTKYILQINIYNFFVRKDNELSIDPS